MAGYGTLKGVEFRNFVSILKTAVGRSDEAYKKIIFKSGKVGAGDGCLSVWIDLGTEVPDFEVPLDVIWAFSKHAGDDVVFSLLEDQVVVKSGEALLVVKRTEVEESPFEVPRVVEVDLKRFVKGLDYVSRPLDEEDSVEIHIFRGRTILVGRSSGISAVFVYGELDWRDTGLRVPYQSSRRTVKFLSGMGKNAKIGVGEDGLVITEDRTSVFLCGEVIEEGVRFPKVEGGIEFDVRVFLRLLERGSDIMGNRSAELIFKSGRVVIRGSRQGIFYTDSVDLSVDVPEFVAEVPLRKLRSYLSNFRGKKAVVSAGWGIVTFRDVKGERFVHIRGKTT